MIMRFLLALMLIVLAACSGGTGKPMQTPSDAVATIRKTAKAVVGKKETPVANTADTVTREQLNGITDSLIRTRTQKTGQRSLLYIAQRNGAAQTWFSPDKASVLMRTGLILRTTGLGTDLYSVEAPAMLAVLERKGPVGAARRVHRTLDGANALVVEVFDCMISDQGAETISVLNRSFSTRHYTEACKSTSSAFENDYWLDTKGVLRLSRQWVGQEYGSLQLERLID